MKRILSRTWKRIVGCFIAGVLAILPLMITVLIVVWVVGFLQTLMGPETLLGRGLERIGLRFAENETIAYAIGWLLVLGVIFLMGAFIQVGAKRILRKLVDGILRRVPLVGRLYDTSRQLVDMMDTDADDKLKGMQPVFCHFGKEHGAGVLALLPTPQTVHINDCDYNIVMVPTAPIPFGGGLMFVPADRVKPANITVDGLMSIYVSMGVTGPRILLEDPNAEKTDTAEGGTT